MHVWYTSVVLFPSWSGLVLRYSNEYMQWNELKTKYVYETDKAFTFKQIK